ncbi:hypothetical protein RB195_022294 [Necator americanus]|uniref:Uncharacterized protein n=1 Tax=Necator americanus TaxID=51031 RepID=A0ABR1EEQ5_NECAM
MTRRTYQHLAPPSKAATENRLGFFDHIIRTPPDSLVRRILRSLADPSWKRPLGRKRSSGMRVWNSDEWADFVQALAEDREGWAELCSKTTHLGDDAGNRVKR